MPVLYHFMKNYSLIIFLLFLSSFQLSHAESDTDLPFTYDMERHIEFGFSKEKPNTSTPTWRNTYIHLSEPLEKNELVVFEISDANQYNTHSQGLSVGYTKAFGGGIIDLDASYSPQAKVLPGHTLEIKWAGKTPIDINYLIGHGVASYGNGTTKSNHLGLEYYFNKLRIAYKAISSSIDSQKNSLWNTIEMDMLTYKNMKFGMTHSWGKNPFIVDVGQIDSVDINGNSLYAIVPLTDSVSINASMLNNNYKYNYKTQGIQFGIRINY